MSDLTKKSITELRTIAQAFGVTDIFEKDQIHLIQEIELKQDKMVPEKAVLPPKPEYDARLMTAVPSPQSSPNEITDFLEPYIVLGLKVTLGEESWSMIYGSKADSGTIRMPPRQIMECARRLMA